MHEYKPINLLQVADARSRCEKTGNTEWEERHWRIIEETLTESLPHGSGIDVDWHFSITGNFLVCSNSYHNMDENGMYDGWTDFEARIDLRYRDMFGKLIIRIVGRFGRGQDTIEYLAEQIVDALENL